MSIHFASCYQNVLFPQPLTALAAWDNLPLKQRVWTPSEDSVPVNIGHWAAESLMTDDCDHLHM